jgi:hypothetical protein
MRIDGTIVFFATTLVAAAYIIGCRSRNPLALAAAAIGAGTLFVGSWPATLLAVAGSGSRTLLEAGQRRLAVLIPRGLRRFADATWVHPAAAAALLAFSVAAALLVYVDRTRPPPGPPGNFYLQGTTAPVRDWLDVQAWARANTAAESVFLAPQSLADEFRVGARRRIWVAWRDGATVMWSPGTWHQWRQRLDETEGMDHDLARANRYACSNGIHYIVLDMRRAENPPTSRDGAVFVNRWFAVHRAKC